MTEVQNNQKYDLDLDSVFRRNDRGEKRNDSGERTWIPAYAGTSLDSVLRRNDNHFF